MTIERAIPPDHNRRMTMNDIKMTAAQILARFNDIDVMETHMCDLDDSEFIHGGRVTDIVQECGYIESGRHCLNDQKAWGETVYDWAHIMGL
jgi:hypothetical protein